ncbi:MAG: SurA N-terminal domain-containing protein [Chitinophagales bacterium]|nr:SurA N-terminal domain-containing protein [Chitinophagales bacterium]
MAIISKIRNRLGPIIVIVIGLALGVFVLETALNSNSSLLKGNKDIVGVVDGNEIHYRDFQNKVDTALNSYKQQTNQNSLDDNTTYMLRDQTWNQMVNDMINGEEFHKLGLTISVNELTDMFMGKDPISEIRKPFTNPQTGTFDPQAVKNYINNLDKPQQGDQTPPGQRRAQWVAFEKAAKQQRMVEKYANLVKGGLYIPKWQAQMDYDEKNTHAEVKYVMVPYTSISDSAVKVTDADIQTYIDAHKEQFKQDENRKLEYVIFSVKPSLQDSEEVVKQINNIYTKLSLAPDDTNDLKLNADNGIDRFYYSKENIASAKVRDTLLKLNIGSLIGPYFEDGAYKIVKLLDRRMVPDSVRARHILIRVAQGVDSAVALKKTDSLYQALKNGASFDSLAIRFSDDKGSGQKGGDLGYMQQGKTVKNFNNFLFFQGRQGEVNVIRTEFGYHIVEILDAKDFHPAVQIVFITRPLEASSETDKLAYEQATQFASKYNTRQSFEKEVSSKPYTKQLAPNVQKNAYQLPGLTSAREIVKWGYSAKVGEVSQVFSSDNNYVVALLTEVKPEGTMSVQDARQQVQLAVLKEKKGAQIAAQLAASGTLNATLESIATKFNQPVKSISNLAFANAYAQDLGFEPKVVGETFALKSNTVSKPILGESGVFVISVSSLNKPTPIADYNSYKQQILSSLQPRLQYGYAEALKKSIKIQDDRYLFF